MDDWGRAQSPGMAEAPNNWQNRCMMRSTCRLRRLAGAVCNGGFGAVACASTGLQFTRPTWGLERDFIGYGETPPRANWPHGARLAISLVVNIEEGSERAYSRGDTQLNESIYDMVEEIKGQPNPTAESHFDYAPRAGYWRLVRLLKKYSAVCTINACAEALLLYPSLARDMVSRGFEISCHGYRWAAPLGMCEDAERKWIADSVSAITQVCGVRPVGWHCRCPQTLNTRRLLMEEGGFLYDSDAYDDDLPRIVPNTVTGGKHVIVPYSLDTNDMRYQLSAAGFPTAEHFAAYCIDAIDCLLDEASGDDGRPKMMSIGLHPRVIGRPGRIAGLERVLAHCRSKGGVWLARRDEIARHWLAEHGNGQ